MWNRTESSHRGSEEFVGTIEQLESRQMFSVSLLSGVETMGPSTSNHTGGVNVVMCDGSVRFVSSGISPTTWR